MYYYMVLLAVVVLSHILFVIHYNPQILFCRTEHFFQSRIYVGGCFYNIMEICLSFSKMLLFIKTVLNSTLQFACGPSYMDCLYIPLLMGFGYTKRFYFSLKFHLGFDFAGIVISP